LEKEQQVQQEIKKMKDTYGDKTVELEAPMCVLTVHCLAQCARTDLNKSQ